MPGTKGTATPPLANQQFRLADSPDGYVRLVNRNSGKAAEVQNASTADAARIVQNTDTSANNQQWQLIVVGGGGGGGNLPSTFRWSSSGVLAGPRPDSAHNDVVAIKDFSVVRHNSQWLVYATTASPSRGWGLVHFAFGDWPQAASAPHTYLDTASAIGPDTGRHRSCSSSLRRTCGTSSTRPARPPTRPARTPPTRPPGRRRARSSPPSRRS